jgi:hypothetical protein
MEGKVAVAKHFAVSKKAIDYTKEDPKGYVLYSIMYKRRSFEHERNCVFFEIDNDLDVDSLQALYDSSEIEWKRRIGGMNPGITLSVELLIWLNQFASVRGRPCGLLRRCKKWCTCVVMVFRWNDRKLTEIRLTEKLGATAA